MAAVTPAAREEARRLLRDDFLIYPERALTIVSAVGEPVPFVLKRPQVRLAKGLMAQRAAGHPMRAVILKARKVGFCGSPETRVLTADLRWVTLDDIAVGQEIVAVDEEPPGGRGRGRKLRRGVVQAKCEVHEPAFRLTMSNGETLVATGPHRFLSRRAGSTETRWLRVDEMRVGTPIRYVTQPWAPPTTDDAWMGGLLDGEGSLRAREIGGFELTISQNHGPVLDRARSWLRDRGFTFREDLDDRPPRTAAHSKLVVNRLNELLALVGRANPTRFREGWWEDRDLPGKRSGQAWAEVESIEPLGRCRMIDLQTDRATYIAEGFVSHNSTQAQGMLVQRTTQIPLHYALVVAQDTRTAGEIFGIGKRMWAMLPDDLKPTIAFEANSRGGRKFMQFGEPSMLARRAGVLGLDATIEISTARDVDAGRGLTIRSLHLSEVAFWMYADKKLGLLNAVPDDPDTLVLEESTANGFNHFKDDWDQAVAGESGYFAMFTPWFEEEGYQRPFADPVARDRFVASIGTGKYGDDEPELLALMEAEIPRLAEAAGMPLLLSAEELRERCYRHLHWRRWAIPAKCQGDLNNFHQEYPSTAEEAFLSTGRRVFRPEIIKHVLVAVEASDPIAPTKDAPGPARGGLVAKTTATLRAPRGITIEVPRVVEWAPASRLPDGTRARWEVWEQPQPEQMVEGRKRPAGQYIVAVDPMSGEENDGELANHAVQVVNHRTLEQCAQYESQDDPDQVALEALMVALHFNGAWIAVETTGGYGLSIVQRLARDYRYPRVYTREAADTRTAKRADRLGWYTDSKTKPLLIDRGTELLRGELDGIRSRRLASQLVTYVRDERGRAAPEPGRLADLLMSWLIAQKVAELRPLKPEKSQVTSTRRRTVVSEKTGW